ncbi:hypothetical protein IBE20_00715 [Francisella tularensis subsp. novicida]|uniref:Uncharacterized protein n=2 Tax=Francisella tularensis TaxID=263 RepID=A0A6I4RLC8_FRATU|nr:hypothetical protein [Francisella tularensis]ABK89826.1 hypothetical protein FTN_0938 [Francisella tularensis subsp. novicida U112]AJI61593.1 hypothetical protein AW25_1074 [Francisella tularensis subsp. novicida U112]EDX27415.1 hypothetical protein FTE_1186 [Francisella tularensis subsp. novicida FTE]MBK2035277.1 hypothetical protein [Francisella tularensis subsp. novicida]MBK2116764.1 hypothetical protein [Francisella tularensis subsp. novicida]
MSNELQNNNQLLENVNTLFKKKYTTPVLNIATIPSLIKGNKDIYANRETTFATPSGQARANAS